ncbi:unnamed protein product [Menidia menidia]|uniref:(Atlantic silverside) hypothetical protein n=1 Tax=Menidia menidia TaxID=238744 RepID=A0A8S4BDC3_9TELE|nr:unnamed protein product [Menidia menidia]
MSQDTCGTAGKGADVCTDSSLSHQENGQRDQPAGGEAVGNSVSSTERLPAQLQRCQREMQQMLTRDPRCRRCPDGWRSWGGHCYFFSPGLDQNRPWNESSAFCRQHNSSLAVIRDPAEMDFLQGVMRNFSSFPFLWVGLTDDQEEGRWLWWDGTDVQHYMPLMVHWDTDYRDCADLRGEGSVFAAECEEYGPWVCKRES